jgi:predicted MarR family transcription regulator
MSVAGIKDMTTTEGLVLHHINHRAREKKLADIARGSLKNQMQHLLP